jgi:hypothetical protein
MISFILHLAFFILTSAGQSLLWLQFPTGSQEDVLPLYSYLARACPAFFSSPGLR